MFVGQFFHNIDEKGRLTIPSRFRELIPESGAYVMRGFDQNLWVFPAPTFLALSQKIQQMNLTDPSTRLLRRLIFSTAGQIEVDKAGRILLPQFLRQAAQLENDVVIAGAGDYFEIWSASLWSEQAALLSDAQSIAERFVALTLPSG